MNVVVTGAIGSGKTSVCRSVIEKARQHGHSCGGVLSLNSDDGAKIAFDVSTGRESLLASRRKDFWGPRIGDYSFSPDGISFGVRALERAVGRDVAVVDELGPLELRGEGFFAAIDLIKSGKFNSSLVVVRRELVESYLRLLRNSPTVFEVTAGNRDELPEKIACLLQARGKSRSLRDVCGAVAMGKAASR